jgi:peptidoglycan/xylan/chitin deacetylase (PgdA/CDA1 family)
MYHEVLPGEPAEGGDDYFAVSRETLGRHLDAIRASGRRGCSLADALAASGQPCVAITFDDGTSGHFAYALPELAARAMTATFFVTTSWVGRPGYVTWDQLRAMRAAGMEIGSHTRSHPFLSELSRDRLWAELAGAREDLDRALDQETFALALPGGDAPRAALRGLLAQAGYRVVGTSRWGRNGGDGGGAVRLVRRCTVRGRPADDVFLRVVAGDPWIGARRILRELTLSAVRSTLGPSRYARWRLRLLKAPARGPGRAA